MLLGRDQPDLIRPPVQTAEIRPNVQDPLEPNFPQSPAQSSSLEEHSQQNGATANDSGAWEADFKQYTPVNVRQCLLF